MLSSFANYMSQSVPVVFGPTSLATYGGYATTLVDALATSLRSGWSTVAAQLLTAASSIAPPLGGDTLLVLAPR